ncbi:MAG TPA: TolC family protein [Gemmata sp.]|nr:TolC family protein [Gemmata sp.]
MTSLARKAILLVAPVSVGCAQIPAPPGYSDAIPESRTLMTKGGPLDTVRPASYQDQPPGQKGPTPLSPPRPFNPSQAPNANPAPTLDGPPTLANLEELADRVNPIIVRDRAQIESNRGQAAQAGIWSNPQFNSNNPEIINGRGTTLNAGFQLEIPVNGKKVLDQSAANEATRQAEIALATDRLVLHASIRQQYYTVLVDQERMDVLNKTLVLVQKSYDTGLARQKAGDLGTADILNFLVDLQRTQAALRSAAAILDGDKKQLEAIIGVPGLIREPLQGKLSGPYPQFDEAELIEYVTKHHTQIASALSVLRQNKILLRRAQVEPLPNPTLGPAYQFGLVPGSDQFWFNLTFNIPVWDLNQGSIRAAKANMAVAAANIDTTRLNLVNQAANLLSQYLAALAIVERFEGKGKDEPGIVANANEAARLYQLMFANKTTDLATLLQAQRTAMQANSDYVDARQNLWNNATQLSGLMQLEKFPETGSKK